MHERKITRSFYERPVDEVAHDLLGKIIVRQIGDSLLSGVITETEAYCVDDPASHAYGGKITRRNTPLFGPVGHTYVYFIYGMHYCLNITARDVAHKAAGGVLIRGIVLSNGSDTKLLTNGPGKIGRIFALTLSHSGIDVTQAEELYILDGEDTDTRRIITTPRIGITKAVDKLWRFLLVS